LSCFDAVAKASRAPRLPLILRKRSFREESAVAVTKGNRSDFLADGLDYKQVADQLNVNLALHGAILICCRYSWVK
jgi:hypothetical protein